MTFLEDLEKELTRIAEQEAEVCGFKSNEEKLIWVNGFVKDLQERLVGILVKQAVRQIACERMILEKGKIKCQR
jgi:hypothetical protein